MSQTERRLTAEAVDRLLHAAETMPVPGPAWDIDLFAQALRIARATETPADLHRAELAFQALSRESRKRLLAHLSNIARRRAEHVLPTPTPRSSGIGGFVAGFLGRGASSGSAAKKRLMSDMGKERQ